MTDIDLLKKAGVSLFGEHWQTALAEALGVNERTVRAWVAGDFSPHESKWHVIHRLVSRRESDLVRLGRLLEDRAEGKKS